MWFYTADTVSRVTATRRPGAAPRRDRNGSTSRRVATALRSLADRLDAASVGAPATDC